MRCDNSVNIRLGKCLGPTLGSGSTFSNITTRFFEKHLSGEANETKMADLGNKTYALSHSVPVERREASPVCV